MGGGSAGRAVQPCAHLEGVDTFSTLHLNMHVLMLAVTWSFTFPPQLAGLYCTRGSVIAVAVIYDTFTVIPLLAACC